MGATGEGEGRGGALSSLSFLGVVATLILSSLVRPDDTGETNRSLSRRNSEVLRADAGGFRDEPLGVLLGTVGGRRLGSAVGVLGALFAGSFR